MKETDWAAMHRRLAAAQRATDAIFAASSEDAGRILHERARALAQPIVQPSADHDEITAVMFTMAREKYAIEARYVRYVARMGEVTAIPGASDAAIGVVNQRGRILPVFDLRVIAGLPVQERTAPAHLIVCGNGRNRFGFPADEVTGVIGIPASGLRERSEPADARESIGIRGITADAVILLDAAALLVDRRLFVELSGTTR